MSESLEHAIVEAALRVVETSAFLTIWPWSEEDGEQENPDTSASMVFHGPCSGRLTLRVHSSLLPTLIQNTLGELNEGDSPVEKSRDALCEVLNMICGNLLTMWQGEEAVFDLSPPEIVNSETADARQPDISVPFTIEGTRAIVDVIMNCGAKGTANAAETLQLSGENG
jgi:CheY-specific phosphatase CheX